MYNNDTMTSMKAPNSAPVKSKKSIKLSRSWAIIVLILIVGGLYGTVHYYKKYKALTVDANVEAQKMTDQYVKTLGKLMELPADETPTVATISDKSKLVGQSFFASAENGDILFAYTNAMKAILYRPNTNKIINVAPISINQPQSLNTATKQGVPASTASVPVTATGTSTKSTSR